MKILVIGTIDNKGGAANVSWNLRRQLKAEGHTVTTFVRYKYSDESDVFVIPRRRFQDWLVKIFANDLRFAWTDWLLKTKEFKEADIIHCHNLHSNFFDLTTLQKMSLQKPVVWTLHDMWAFTGFASNSWTLRHPNKKKFLLFLWDNTAHLLRLKKSIYKKSKLYLVAVSDWMKREVSKSVLAGHPITRIYNGIDTDTFKPCDKTLARKELGLPLDKKIIAFGIKGWPDSNKIVDHFAGNENIFFTSIGHTIKTENKNYRPLPHTRDRGLLAKYFNAADVFLHPTPEDSFGLISAEALSCGIPVVTYAADALPEIVIHKEVGYAAEYQNTDDAKAGILYILNLSKENGSLMSEKARKRIVENFTSEKMYAEYLALYKKILEERV